jgi:hypothetical protein
MSLGTSIARATSELLSPLEAALRDPKGLALLLDELGWTTVITDAEVAKFGALVPVATKLQDLAQIVADHEAGHAEAGALAAKGAEVAAAAFDAISTLSSLHGNALAGWPAPLDDPTTWKQLALDLPEYLLLRWLQAYHPLAYALVDLAGALVVADWRQPGQTPRVELSWDALTGLLRDPPAQLSAAYNWGGPIEYEKLLERLHALAHAAGWGAQLEAVPPTLAATWWPGGPGFDVRQLAATLHSGTTADGAASLRVSLVLLPVPGPGRAPNRLLLTLEVVGSASASVKLSDDWSLTLEGGADASGVLGFLFGANGVALADGPAAVGASLTLTAAPATPWRLLGDEGTRLELGGLALGLGLTGTTSAPVLALDVGTSALRLVVAPGDGDSFLADVLGGSELAIDGAFDVGWSSAGGFHFVGGLGFDVRVSIGKTVGPLRADWIHVVLLATVDGVSAALTVTGGLALGPFNASVEDIGLRGEVTTASGGDGNLGPVEAALAFVPPTGLGLTIDAGVVSGGGFLSFDADAGRYAGVLSVDILGVGINALGVLLTELPDGRDGWSLFFSLSAKLAGVPLGFGFFLNGVGGLVGVNRGLDLDALGDGVRSGALDGILFSDDAIADAPFILSQIDEVFPPNAGQYVFGPIAEIGWGIPTLLSVELGVVLELPDPITISLLGSLEIVLPVVELPILELHVDVAGSLDPAAGLLRIDASVHDSQVLGIALTGDMAVRASFLEGPTLLIAFGGFHPAFTPPDDFPKLARMGIALDAGDDLKLTIDGYFAVTSNTLQFGASADLSIHSEGFEIAGGCSFDALMIRSPFSFSVDLGLYVRVTAVGVDLLAVYCELAFSGPNPWKATGTATFKALGISTHIHVSAKIGDKEAVPSPETVFLGAALRAALGEASAWAAVAPVESAVLLVDAAGDTLRIHPAGRVEVRQILAPLDRTLDHVGDAKLGDGNRFSLASPTLGGTPATLETVEDQFPAAQFFDLTEEEKLSAPSFESMPCGARLGDVGASAGAAADFPVDYEQIVRDPAIGDDRELDALFAFAATDLTAAVAVAQVPASAFALVPATFVLSDPTTGKRDAAPSMSWSEARTARATAATKQVVPVWEVSS